MLSALIFQSFGLFMFASTYFLENNEYIIIVAVLARLINGCVNIYN